MIDRRWVLSVLFLSFLLLIQFWPGSSLAAKPEPLQVLAVHPSGPTPRVKQITVVFDQAMVPLGEMDRPFEEVPVVFTPELPGRFRWLNVYSLAFELDKPLEGSFEGEITVKKGITSLDGSKLKEDYTSKFSLPLIELRRVLPKPGAAGLALRPEMELAFNQPLIQERLQNDVYFTAPDGSKVPARVRADEEANAGRNPGDDWVVKVSPAADLTPDAPFELVIPAGLASASGPLPSTREFRLNYRTYGPLEVVGIVGYRPQAEAPFDPESGLEIKFTTPVSPRQVVENLKVSPDYDLTQIEGLEAEAEPVSALWLPGPFQAASLYTFTFASGLKDVYGQTIKGRTNFQIVMGPARPVLELPGRHGVLERSDDPSYPVRVRNINRINFRGCFLPPEKIIPFLIKHKLYRYLSESSDDFLADVPPYETKTESIKVTAPPNAVSYQPVRLRQLFGPEPGPGAFYFDLAAPETNDPKTGRPVYRRAVVQVTDIGLSVKFGQTNTLIWTTKLAEGQPLGRAAVEIRDARNYVLWRGQTDEQGLALAPGADQLKLQQNPKESGQPSLFVLAYHEDQFSFISTEWHEGIAPWNFGLSGRDYDEGQETLTWVLTALPLYKPGEEVRFKLIRRRNTPRGLFPPGPGNIMVEIQDSRGGVLEKTRLEMTSFGTASGRFLLPRTAPLGSYSILIGDDRTKMKYAGGFRVEEYRKPAFDLEIIPSQETALVGDKISARLKADYHFGSPVAGQPVDYLVSAGPADFTLPRFEDYNIIDWSALEEDEAEPIPTIAQGRLDLDRQGQTALNFQALPSKKPQPRYFQIEATVTDVDQRTVSRRQSILVHPASFYLGLKTDRHVISSGEKMTVNLIAATPEGRLVPEVVTDLVLVRRTWQTVRRKGVGGYYHHISEPSDTIIQRIRIKTTDRPLGLDFTLSEGGFYYVTAQAKDQDGRTTASAVGFYAYGQGSAGWARYDHDRIDLVQDKEEYRPGETATVLIKSPFTQATGLLTVERNGVRRHQIFQVTGPAPAVQVRIEPDDFPNVYVSVLLVRGRISDQLDEQGRDPGKPAFKAGYAEIKVADESSRLKVEVSPDRPQARPGQEVELTVKAVGGDGRREVTEVAVIVADAALLQLGSEDAYYPERLFFASRSLAVWTADLRINLIGRRHYGLKGAKAGGGGLDAEAAERYRRHFVSLAFFEPHLVTDDMGRAKVRFKLPDNLTTFKIFAVANTQGGRFGTGVGSIQVTKPMLIKTALPGFAGIGDEFTANVVIHNRTYQAGQATITLSGENFELLEEGGRTVNLGARSSMEIGFPVRILPGTEAVFRFDAVLGGEMDSAEFRLPLRYPNPVLTSATYGRLTKSVREMVMVPKEADPERGGLTLRVSPSLSGALKDAFAYLENYPHGCLEQQTSRALGDLLYLHWRERFGGPEENKNKAEARLTKYFEGLTAFQTFDGGMSFWPEIRPADPFLTAYVVQCLHQALSYGWPIEAPVFQKARAYLNQTVNRDQWPGWYDLQDRLTAGAYIIAVLAEAGDPVAPMVENLYGRRDQLSTFALALLLETLGLSGRDEAITEQKEDIEKRLFGRAVITSGEVHFEEETGSPGLWASKIRTNAVALKALLRASPDNPHLAPLARWLINARRDGHWGNTQNNALTLLALTESMRIMEDQPPEFSLMAVLDLRPLAQADFHSFETPPLERIVPMRDLALGRKLPVELGLEGQGSAYYTLRLDYAGKELDLKARQAGFAVTRTYTRLTGPEGQTAEGKSFRRGDLVRVDLTLLVPAQRHWVVLEDKLPAGLEPINFDLPTAPEHLRQLLDQGHKPEEYYRQYWYEHREIRPDRIAVFARTLTEGAYNFSYLARAVTPGRFAAPGPRVEEMYSPEVSAAGEGMVFEIERD